MPVGTCAAVPLPLSHSNIARVAARSCSLRFRIYAIRAFRSRSYSASVARMKRAIAQSLGFTVLSGAQAGDNITAIHGRKSIWTSIPGAKVIWQ